MPKILIVEDDAITLRIYTTHLQRAGYEIKAVGDGNAAVEELDSFQPDGCPNAEGARRVLYQCFHPQGNRGCDRRGGDPYF